MPKQKTPRKIIPELITPEEWAIYEAAMKAANDAKVPFLMGGAFALAVYTGRWRNTKDIDLLVMPDQRDVVIDALTRAGFKDYYEQLPYDRGWIYRSTRENYIVDVIWRMANRRADVDHAWFEKAPAVSVWDEVFYIVPPEELLWHKIYVLQRDRCDWPDVFNLLYAVSAKLDWDYLLRRVGPDAQLLGGVLNVFTWLCPGHLQVVPAWVRERFRLLDPPEGSPDVMEQNVRYLDSRDWFAAMPPPRVLMSSR